MTQFQSQPLYTRPSMRCSRHESGPALPPGTHTRTRSAGHRRLGARELAIWPWINRQARARSGAPRRAWPPARLRGVRSCHPNGRSLIDWMLDTRPFSRKLAWSDGDPIRAAMIVAAAAIPFPADSSRRQDPCGKGRDLLRRSNSCSSRCRRGSFPSVVPVHGLACSPTAAFCEHGSRPPLAPRSIVRPFRHIVRVLVKDCMGCRNPGVVQMVGR